MNAHTLRNTQSTRSTYAIVAALAILGTAAFGLSRCFSSSSDIELVNGVQMVQNPNATAPGVALVGVAMQTWLSPGSQLSINWWPTGCTTHPDDQRPSGWTGPESENDILRPGCGYSPDVLNILVDGSRVYYTNVSDENAKGRSFFGWSFENEDDGTFNTRSSFSTISPKGKLSSRVKKQDSQSKSAWYPFDIYTTSITIEAFSDFNTTEPIPIHFIEFSDSNPGSETALTKMEGAKTSRSTQGVKLTFAARRSLYVKTIAMGLFFANHVLAAAMLSVAIRAQAARPLPQSALFLPLASALLMPQLRSSMPSFDQMGYNGIYWVDALGYYIDIVAVIISATIMVFKIFSNNNFERHGDSASIPDAAEKRSF